MLTLEERISRLETLFGLRDVDPQSECLALLADVAASYRLTAADITGPRRFGELIPARQLFCWLAHRKGLSQSAIGRMINRDHSAVFYALAATEDRLEVNADFRRSATELATLHKIKI